MFKILIYIYFFITFLKQANEIVKIITRRNIQKSSDFDRKTFSLFLNKKDPLLFTMEL
jgi:hypothetical protein